MIVDIIRMRVLIEGGPYMRKYGTYCQLGFSSGIEVAQLSSAWLGTFIARLELENSGLGSSLLSTYVDRGSTPLQKKTHFFAEL